ncbi:MAG: T9SS type A sorting domain-containing protein [Bacteroidia bacterium]
MKQISTTFIFLFCFFKAQLVAQTPVDVTLGSARNLPDEYYGLNGTNTIDDGQGWNSLNSSTSGVPNDLQLNSIGNCNIRYPGGTVGNYWDWRKGYFFKQIPGNLVFPPSFEGRKNNWYDPTYSYDIEKPDNRLRQMKRSFMKSGCTPLFTMNLLTSDYNYQLGMLYHASELNIPVQNIELGNEYYSQEENHLIKFPSVPDYSYTAMEWAKKLKTASVFAGSVLNIAAVGASFNENDWGRRRLWLKNLLNEFATNSDGQYIDAVTIHVYLGGGTNLFEGVVPNCGANVTQNFEYTPPYPNDQVPLCMLRKMLIRPFAAMDELEQSELLDIENAGKQTWITEYNLFDRGDYYIHGTWAAGLFAAAMTLNWLEDENITKINMHTMVGNAVWSNVFAMTDGFDFSGFSTPLSSLLTNKWELTAIGNAMTMVGEAMKHATSVEPLTFTISSNPPVNIDPDYLGDNHPVLYGYRFTKTDADETVIINFHEIGDYEFTISDIMPGSYSGYEYEIMEGDPFYHVTGNATIGSIISNNALGQATLVRTGLNVTNGNSTVILPGYSILRVRGIKSTALSIIASDDVVCNTPELVEPEPCETDVSRTSVIASHGTPPYSFSYSASGITGAINIVQDPDFLNVAYVEFPLGTQISLAPATLTVTVTDNSAATASVNISVYPTPSITFNSNPCESSYSICPGEQINIEAFLTGGDGIYPDEAFLWTPTSGLNCNFCNPVNFSLEKTDDIVLYATDGTCFVSNDLDPIHVTVDPVIKEIDPPQGILCDNTSHNIELNVILDEPISGVTYTYQWRDPQQNIVSTSSVCILSNTSLPGNYTIIVTNPNSGCSASATVSISFITCCEINGFSSAETVLPHEYDNTEDWLVDLNAIYPGVWDGLNLEGTLFPSGFAINGNFHIDETLAIGNDPDILTLKACNITMGENSRIFVDPEVTLNVTEACSLSTCGNFLWNGFIVADEAATLNIDGTGVNMRNRISDATVAVDASRSAVISILNNDFINNFKDIALKNYFNESEPGTNGNVYGNNFTCPNLKVFTPEKTWKSIELDNVLNIRIGRVGTGNDNNFSEAQYGVWARNSSFDLRNNNFSEFQRYYTDMIDRDLGTAVFATSANLYNDRKIIIGTDPEAPSSQNGRINVFDNNFQAVKIVGEYNVSVRTNTFNSVTGVNRRLYDINISSNLSKTISIRSNTIDAFNRSIYLYNFGHDAKDSPEIKIYENNISSYNTSATGNYYGTAIDAQNPTSTGSKISIFSNVITDARYGIHALNVNRLRVGGFDESGVVSLPNNIYYNLGSGTLTDFHHGIWLQRCSDADVLNNVVSNDDPSPDANLRGIVAEHTLNANIGCNVLTNLGRAMRFEGDCTGMPGTELKNNEMNEYEEAIELLSAKLPTQGEPNSGNPNLGIPWDNNWNHSDPANHLKVSGTPLVPGLITWYHQGADIATNSLSPRPFLTFLIDPKPNQTQVGIPCENSHLLGGFNRDERYGAVVGDSATYIDYESEMSYAGKTIVFETLKQNDSLLTLGLTSDASFQLFYDNMSETNIGILSEVATALDSNLVDTALVINETVIDTNNIEYSRKKVNEVLIEKIFKEIAPTAGDTLSLEYIFYQHWITAGISVYDVAAMLDREYHSPEISLRVMKPDAINHIKANEIIKVYPKPATDKLFISELQTTYNEIEIYDCYDRLVFKQNFRLQMVEIDLLNFKNGIYFLKIIGDSEKIFKTNFTVIK